MPGFFQETEYEAMYAISSPLALFLEDGTSDFTENAKLWVLKLEVFQCALHPDEFESGELDAIRTIEGDYYGGGLKTPMAFLDRAMYLAE